MFTSTTIIRGLTVLYACMAIAKAGDAQWPQFRGPDGLGLGTGTPPLEFGPDKNVLWQIPTPKGHSSPCLWDGKIFLTGVEDGKLLTLCYDRDTGRELWRAVAPAEKIESTHRIASPASPTPCTDGERVYAYFGSFGLLAYDFAGREVWRSPQPPPMVEFGTGSSPILAGDNVILVCDQDLGSYVVALDRRTGKEAWRAGRSEFRRSFSTPFLWKHDGTQEIIVAGSLAVKSYDPKDGRELWTARGLARVANASPVAGDGMLIVSSWNVGGDDGSRLAMPPFEEFAAEHDKNHDGVLTIDEFPPGPVHDRFSQMDLDKDGKVTRDEYEHMRQMFAQAVNQLFAIKPGGYGDITDTHVLWNSKRHLPYVSSPLCYNGRVFTIKNGGLASSYDAKSGRVLYLAERMDAPGDYYSSAVGAAGRVYVASQKGTVVVLDAGDAFHVLARNAIGESIFATPAVVDGRLYLRSEGHLWAFGSKGAKTTSN